MSDQKFKCYMKGKRALTYSGSEVLDYVSNRETVRTKTKEVLDYISNREAVRTMTKDEGISQRYLR